jgi:hypothetical protein
MPRKKPEPTPPLYPLHHQHADSLTNALQAAGNLLAACETLLSTPGVLDERVAKILAPRVAQVKLAFYGEEP